MANVDPNIQAILDEHRRELDLIAQQFQNQHQRDNARDANKVLQNFIKDHKDKINICDGSSLRAVREWMRNISSCVHRVPQGQNEDLFVISVTKATASGDLLDEIEQFLRNQPNANQAELRDHINASFLGPDEANVLKDELKSIRQGQREEIPNFNRRFLKAAEHAYPLPRDAATDELLTEMFLGALANGRIKDKCFSHDPRVADLQTVTTVASNEWARQRRRVRIQRDYSTNTPEPMEVDSSENTSSPPLRETLAAMASSLRRLQGDVNTLKAGPSPSTARASVPAPTPRQDQRRSITCWYCGIIGHHQKDCRRRKRENAPLRSTAPLPPQSVSKN